jgi:cyanophycinase
MRLYKFASIVFLAVCSMLAHADGASVAAKSYCDKHFDYFVGGDPSKPRAAHTEFGLALMGGGGNVDAAFRFLVERAGHGHIVVLRASDADSPFDAELGNYYGDLFVREWGPVVSVETISFRDREAANDPRVAKIIEGADGIFLAGGDQSRYVRYWKGTPVQRLLEAHVAANRPIGGTSAGLAVLGHYVYSALGGHSAESKVVLADPFDASVSLEGDFLHYRFMENIFTDTHFGKRHRLGRLIVFLARLDAAKKRIDGIGIDERTVLLVGADGIGRLAEGSAGFAWFVEPQKPATQLAAGKPLSMPDIRLIQFGTGSSIDLKTRAVTMPVAEATMSVADGKLTAASIATPIFARAEPQPGED